ncbi:MAG TPA: HAD-IIIA family hydrolase [Gemmataceae bacterium]|nr:HAD-IIIA family hydrolase [Gemmataceae bacterium]
MFAKKTNKPALFLDRDGTLIEERSYLALADEVSLLPGAAAAVERMRCAGFVCVVVTNQSGVGRALLTLAQMHAVNDEMQRQLREAGTQLDGLYFCTYAPVGDDKTVIEHPDRKPGPGMLLRASLELGLDLPASWVVGDSVSDVLAGRHAGCRGQILVRTGHDLTEALAYLGNDAMVANDLAEAADLILKSKI